MRRKENIYYSLGFDLFLSPISIVLYYLKTFYIDFSNKFNKKADVRFWFFVLFITFINSFRVPISDLSHNINMFSAGKFEFNFEFSYQIINFLLTYIPVSFEYSFKFFWPLFMIYFLYKATTNLKLFNPYIFKVLLISPFFFGNSLHLIQQFVSVCVFFYAFSLSYSTEANSFRLSYKSIAFIIFSITLHLSSVVLLFTFVFSILLYKYFNAYLLVSVIILSLFFQTGLSEFYSLVSFYFESISSDQAFLEKVQYSERRLADTSFQQNILSYVEISLYFILIYLVKNLNTKLKNYITFPIIFLFFVCILFYETPIIANRLYKGVEISKFILVPLAFKNLKSKWLKNIFYLVFSTYFIFRFFQYLLESKFTFLILNDIINFLFYYL